MMIFAYLQQSKLVDVSTAGVAFIFIMSVIVSNHRIFQVELFIIYDHRSSSPYSWMICLAEECQTAS